MTEFPEPITDEDLFYNVDLEESFAHGWSQALPAFCLVALGIGLCLWLAGVVVAVGILVAAAEDWLPLAVWAGGGGIVAALLGAAFLLVWMKVVSGSERNYHPMDELREQAHAYNEALLQTKRARDRSPETLERLTERRAQIMAQIREDQDELEAYGERRREES